MGKLKTGFLKAFIDNGLIGKNCDLEDFEYLNEHAERLGVSLTSHELFLRKTASGRLYLICTMNGVRRICQNTGELEGISDIIYNEMPDGSSQTLAQIDTKNIKTAKCVVKRKSKGEYSKTVLLNEFKNEKMNHWQTQPAHQLGNIAEMAALRMAFPDECSGLFLSSEFGSIIRNEKLRRN